MNREEFSGAHGLPDTGEEGSDCQASSLVRDPVSINKMESNRGRGLENTGYRKLGDPERHAWRLCL